MPKGCTIPRLVNQPKMELAILGDFLDSCYMVHSASCASCRPAGLGHCVLGTVWTEGFLACYLPGLSGVLRTTVLELVP